MSSTTTVPSISLDAACCRICLDSAPIDDLIRPCACRGSIAHVHRKCLDDWRRTDLDRADAFYRCDLCKTTFELESTQKLRCSSCMICLDVSVRFSVALVIITVVIILMTVVGDFVTTQVDGALTSCAPRCPTIPHVFNVTVQRNISSTIVNVTETMTEMVCAAPCPPFKTILFPDATPGLAYGVMGFFASWAVVGLSLTSCWFFCPRRRPRIPDYPQNTFYRGYYVDPYPTNTWVFIDSGPPPAPAPASNSGGNNNDRRGDCDCKDGGDTVIHIIIITVIIFAIIGMFFGTLFVCGYLYRQWIRDVHAARLKYGVVELRVVDLQRRAPAPATAVTVTVPVPARAAIVGSKNMTKKAPSSYRHDLEEGLSEDVRVVELAKI